MPVLPSYRNQWIDLHGKSIDWFLDESNTGIEWVKYSIRVDPFHMDMRFSVILEYNNVAIVENEDRDLSLTLLSYLYCT